MDKPKRKPKEKKPGQRMLRLRVVAKNIDDYKRAMNAIRAYRKLFNKVAEVTKALEVASAEFTTTKSGELLIKLNQKNFTELAKAIFGDKVKHNSAPFYELRPFYFSCLQEAQELDKTVPDFNSFIWDELRRTMNAIRCKKDPDNGIPRNKLEANAKRDPVKASRVGINITHANGAKHTRIYEDAKGQKLIDLNYDLTAGPLTLIAEGAFEINGEMQYKELNYGSSYVLHKLITGEWEFQTITMNEDDGSLTLNIPYRRPPEIQRASDYDPDKTLEVSFQKTVGETKENAGKIFYIHCRVPKLSATRDSDKYRTKSIAVNDILAHLSKLGAQKHSTELQKSTCGWQNKTRKKALKDRMDRLSIHRMRICKDQNHQWSKQIVGIANSFGCGKILVYGPPSGVARNDNQQSGLLGYPWDWSGLKAHLTYKAEHFGIKLEFTEPVQSAKIIKAFNDDDDVAAIAV